MANGAAAAEAAAGAPHEQSPLLEAVGFYALESRNDGVLWDRAPACVIMYDSDVAFVRQLEVGACRCCCEFTFSSVPSCHWVPRAGACIVVYDSGKASVRNLGAGHCGCVQLTVS